MQDNASLTSPFPHICLHLVYLVHLTFCIVIIIDEAIDFEDAFIHDSESSSFKNQYVMVKLSLK